MKFSGTSHTLYVQYWSNSICRYTQEEAEAKKYHRDVPKRVLLEGLSWQEKQTLQVLGELSVGQTCYRFQRVRISLEMKTLEKSFSLANVSKKWRDVKQKLKAPFLVQRMIPCSRDTM